MRLTSQRHKIRLNKCGELSNMQTNMQKTYRIHWWQVIAFALIILPIESEYVFAEDPPALSNILAKPDLFKPLTEPPCSYCSTQNRKGFVESDDLVLAWIRGAHNGGAIPVRHFLSAPRVI